jgi:hypothetical protein
MFPDPSTKRLKPWSMLVPPHRLAQTKFPLLSSLETKTSSLPALVKLEVPAPGSKSAVPENLPVV